MKEIVLIGAGRVATHLAERICALGQGYRLSCVYSRSRSSAEALVARLRSPVPCVSSLSKLPNQADIYLFALPDGALDETWATMPQTGGIWVHTAGSVSLEAIQVWHTQAGVLYPLQTFSLERTLSWDELPIYIEGSNNEVESELELLALSLSPRLYHATSAERGHLHLSAVLACNFTNHLLALAEEYLSEQGLDPKAIYPLVRETLAKAEEHQPRQVQTGPAIRGDEATIQRHLSLLAGKPQLAELYRSLTKSIQSPQES